MKVVALAGGTGGAKLLDGLDRALPNGELTAVVNTGDDAVFYGVHVSPDVDMVTYWLAGIADFERGWGIAGDRFTLVDALGSFGVDNWFRLGDSDFATCLYRTQRLHDGLALSAATEEIRVALGVRPAIVPMSDDAVRTQVEVDDGRVLEFQEYFVKEKALPEVTGVSYAGAEDAKPAPGVLDAIADADIVVVCPSNPVLSIGPILAVQGIRDALIDHDRVLAVSPLVRGAALKGPADRILTSLGIGAGAAQVAGLYRDFCDLFVLDATEDPRELERASGTGVAVRSFDTIMTTHDAAIALARALIHL